MKDKILKLKAEGKTQQEIVNILKCAKSTVCYHLNPTQKDKHRIRTANARKRLNGILKRKKDNFSFIYKDRLNGGKRKSLSFSMDELKAKIIPNPICYLTGRKIDLLNSKSYHFDHIIPVSKGGGCNLENLALTCREANIAKSNLMIDQFLDLCKEVLIHHGYNVSKVIL